MLSQISRAAEEANSRFQRRMYDPHMNVPGTAELYLVISTIRWPVDFIKSHAMKPCQADPLHHA